MGFARAIRDALGGDGDTGQRLSFDDKLKAVIQSHGSNTAAARHFGVSESTVRRWLGGGRSHAPGRRASRDRAGQTVPKGGNLGKVVEEFTTLPAGGRRAATMSPGTAAQWRAGFISATVIVGGQSRTIHYREGSGNPARSLAPGTGRKIVEAFLRGDDKGAARAFVGGVQDDWYRERFENGDDDLRGEEFDAADPGSIETTAGGMS